jgi:hypothetical protein
MGEQDEGSWRLVVKFVDRSASFVNGFAAGQIWEAMTRSDPRIEKTVREENEEIIRRMAHAEGYSVEWTPTDFGWADVSLIKTGRSKESPIAPGRFSVITGGSATPPKGGGE